MTIAIWHVRDLSPADRLDRFDLAVVIDVIRAFTVAPWILRQGAAQLLLAPDTAVALEAQATTFPGALLLKDGLPDARFDLPNAPGRIAREDLRGRTVIQTTGNGTRGAHAVAQVPTVVCASFVTAAATAAVMRHHRRVLLLVTEGDEDQALAEYLTALATGAAADPAAYLRRVVASEAGRECAERGPDPDFPGFDADDLARCLELDAFEHALFLRPAGGLLAVVPNA